MRNPLWPMVLLAIATASPAWADTMQDVAAHGIVVSFRDAHVELTFTPDHKYTDAGGQLTGTWRIVDDRVCSSSAANSVETCIPIPQDKKSGDSFDVTLPLGAATVKIK